MRVPSHSVKLMICTLVILFLVLFTVSSAGRRRRKKRKGTSVAPDSPVIRRKQYTMNTIVNSTVRLPCKAKKQWTVEEKKILFYWTMQGTLIKNFQPKYEQVPNGYLEIKNVQISDAGWYTCTAENSNGKDSVKRLLIVNGHTGTPIKPFTAKPATKGIPPPIFTHNYAPRLSKKERSVIRKKVYSGSRVKMRCAIRGEPEPSITWFRSGKPLRSVGTAKYKYKANKYQLVIKNFRNGDAGNYSCRATNKLGQKSITYILRYNGARPPTKPTEPEYDSVVLLRGQNYVLHCSTAKQALMLTWQKPKTSKVRPLQKNTQALFSNRMIKFNGSFILKYYLTNVTEADSGLYQCVGAFSGKNVVRFKVVTIKVVKELGVVDPPSPEPSGWRMPLFLVISIPLIAGLFFVVIIIFCWRYHKKLREHRFSPVSRGLLPPYNDPSEEHILGPIPQGSLRFHKSHSRSLKADSKHLYLRDGEKFYFSHGFLEQNKINSDSPPRQSRSATSLPNHHISVNSRYDQNSYQVVPLVHRVDNGRHVDKDSKHCNGSGNQREPPDKPATPSTDSACSRQTDSSRPQCRRNSAPDSQGSPRKNSGGRPDTWPKYRPVFLDEAVSESEGLDARIDDGVDSCSCPLRTQSPDRFFRKPGRARGSRENLDRNENLCVEGTSLSDMSLKASSSGCSSGASLMADEDDDVYVRRHSICRNTGHSCVRNFGHNLKEDAVYSADPCCECAPPGYLGVKLKCTPLADGEGCYSVCPPSIKHTGVSCGSEYLANAARTCEYSPVGT